MDGVLHTSRTAPQARLASVVASIPTVELNASFDRWPSDVGFARWRDRLADDFVVSAKAPRGSAHAKKLLAAEAWTARIAGGWHER